jgi:hypothetical protein
MGRHGRSAGAQNCGRYSNAEVDHRMHEAFQTIEDARREALLREATAETGRAVECIAILLLVNLSPSLVTALLMNLYNRRVMARGGGVR